MSMARRLCTVALTFSAWVAAVRPGGAIEASLVGAWVEVGTECAAVFAQSGKARAFKKPLDLFAPAFIISGTRVKTPQASCRIRRVSVAGDRRILSLACTTTIATDDVTAIIAPAPDGTLRRFLNRDDTLGSVYNRCN